MTQPSILDEILKELKRARKKSFPVHIVAQAAQVTRHAGVLLDNASRLKYETNNESDGQDRMRMMEGAAFLTAVNAIRFIEELRKEKK